MNSHNADLPEEFVRVRQQLRLTSPAWTWTDLALKRSLLDGLILADQVLRPARPAFDGTNGALGWLEVRITKEHMRNRAAAAVAKIVRALRIQGWRHPITFGHAL